MDLLTFDRATSELRSLGVSDGDTVMVHASLRRIGPVEDGPMTIARALQTAVGPSGTVTAYVSWAYSPYERTLGGQRMPACEERDWPQFERLSPAYPGFGAMNSFLLSLDEVRRSAHPDASILAVGSKADWIVEPHALGTGYGPGSPIARIIELDAKVLLLGAPLDAVTVLHYAEAVARIPEKRWVTYWAPQAGTDGSTRWVEVIEPDSNGIVEVFASEEGPDAIETIAATFIAERRAIQQPFGQATGLCFSARDIVEFGVAYLETYMRAR
ncbi:aminoglycoside 3-N-acetyltransferase [Ensifer sp. ENS09]|uniref:aminoglycoside 3-N-acetyltransferase n=1 Tax=Ensifer sp. ENS09 TaxID=2769263 RepID=UPI00177B1AF4|nr:aminoglycoside 3-N-acetyltransferase [Ensifer sp. ENS09]MBD9652875.1 aminoglycoside 3-N-acetyltransferase [Ensifer sp. ENS09]